MKRTGGKGDRRVDPTPVGLRLNVKDEMVPAAIGGHPELAGIIPMLEETVIILRPADEGEYAPVEQLRAVVAVPRES